MKSTIRSTAVSAAIVLFFTMALIGWLFDNDPSVCAKRALLGAVVIYIVVSYAGKIVTNIIINAIVDSKLSRLNRKDNKR